jgi:hypothetical protein
MDGLKMAEEYTRQSKFLKLMQKNVWNIEDFIALLKEASQKRTDLAFYGRLAGELTSSLSLLAIFKMRDPRENILNFVMNQPFFNKVEIAYYQQIFKPVLEEMMSGQPNCIRYISSSGFFKRALIHAILARFNVEPHFINFTARLQNAIESRIG